MDSKKEHLYTIKWTQQGEQYPVSFDDLVESVIASGGCPDAISIINQIKSRL